jgi:hypothetical protein
MIGKESIMTQWLKCDVKKGMFSDELTVTVQTRSGEAIAVFIPRQAADDQKNLVKVETFEQGGNMVAILPDDHRSVVDVNAFDLEPA